MCSSDLLKPPSIAADTGSAFTHLLLLYEEIIMNDYSVYLLDALEQVMSWDLADDDLADAVNSQARLMAGGLDQYEDNTIVDNH